MIRLFLRFFHTCGIPITLSQSHRDKPSIMDGLRELAKSSPYFPVEFFARADERFATATITLGAGGLGFQRANLGQDDLQNFFRHNQQTLQLSKLPEVVHTLKLASLPRRSTGVSAFIYVDNLVFQSVLRDMCADPWVEHLIRSQAHGFHHSGSPGDGVATFYLGTSFSWTVWTCRRESSGTFSTKCLTTVPAEKGHPGPIVMGGPIFDRATALLDVIHAFRKDSHSALYFPLVLAVNVLRYRESIILKNLELVRSIEAKTGHGS